MQLSTTQQLIQEGLLSRISQRSKEIQDNVPEKQPNLLVLITAATAILASEVEGEANPKAIDMLVESSAFVLAKEVALANLAVECKKLRDEIGQLKTEVDDSVVLDGQPVVIEEDTPDDEVAKYDKFEFSQSDSKD